MATTQPLPADIPVQESEQPAAMVANESALISSSLVLEEEGSLGLDPKFAPLPIELDVAIPLREFRVAMPGDRTEQATPHRREKARKEGDVLHSRELQAAAGTLAGVMALKLLASRATENWRSALAGFLNLGRASNWEPQGLQPTLATLRALSLSVLAPIGAVLVAIVLAALFAGVAQRGSFALNVAAVGFRLDRINPLTNVKNLF